MTISEQMLNSMQRDTEVALSGTATDVQGNKETAKGTKYHKWTLLLPDNTGKCEVTWWGSRGNPPGGQPPAEGAYMTLAKAKVGNPYGGVPQVSIFDFSRPQYLAAPPGAAPAPNEPEPPREVRASSVPAGGGVKATIKTVDGACGLMADIYNNLANRLPDLPAEQVQKLAGSVFIQTWMGDLSHSDPNDIPF